MAAPLSPMSLFEDQLSSDDSSSRLSCMKKLQIVGHAMGLSQTLTSLIPFLRTNCIEDDDEMLLRMGENLGQMVPGFIPGDQASGIVDILEQLCSVEETVVRSAAVNSLSNVIQYLPVSSGTVLVQMVKRLATAEWFTSRVSACGLFSSIYKLNSKSDENQTELRSLYKLLSEDETPMVRRSAAFNLSDFCAVITKEKLISDIVPIHRKLSTDEQDTVRTLSVVVSVALSSALNDVEVNYTHLFPIVKGACVDRSWRVRHCVALNYPKLLGALDFEGTMLYDLIQSYAVLLKDTEGEVRASGCANIARVSNISGEALFVSDVSPCLEGLGKDPVMEVRSKLAQSVMECTDASICNTITDDAIIVHIKPIIEDLLRDEDEVDEVKIHILKRLPQLTRLLSQMDEVVSIVTKLASYEANWRIRESVAMILPSIAEAFGIAIFEKNGYLTLWLKLIQDQVANVRTSCVTGVPMLLHAASKDSQQIGANWVIKNVVNHLKSVWNDSSFYSQRVTIIGIYAAFLTNKSVHKILQDEILTHLLNGLLDPVPNVRMVSARNLLKVIEVVSEDGINLVVKPFLVGVNASLSSVGKEEDVMDKDLEFRGFLKKINFIVE